MLHAAGLKPDVSDRAALSLHPLSAALKLRNAAGLQETVIGFPVGALLL